MNGRAERGVRFQRRTPVSIHAKASRGFDRFEIKNDETTYREWCVPAELLNTKATLALWDEWDEVEINLDR
jgi:hypothetical protein